MCVDELHHLKRMLGRQSHVLQLFRLQSYILTSFVLIAFDDFVARNGTFVRHHSLVTDTLAGRFLQLMQFDLPAGVGGRIESDREGNEGDF